MSYLALYRRFRPNDFTKVIGQDVIVKTLSNQIQSDRIGHAYLFCGARGTGKTSLAKIFAKAVNCLRPIDGSPCLKCEACLALNDPSNIDVLEMDAASNNRVENVRELRETIQYAPVKVRYKVYIIDEVHMLTSEAFNALLKTLEEPPKHAIFILATTEPQKLPATILSRCMRFDFRLISTDLLKKLVCDIYNEIGKAYEEEAVVAIAKAGEGSVRDTLSIADLCVSVGKDKLTYDDVISVLGASDATKTNRLIKNMFLSNTGEVLSSVDELISQGKSIGVLAKDISLYLRDLLVVKSCKDAKKILSLPEDKFNSLVELSSLANESRILRSIEIISSIDNELRYSNQQRSVFETALIKASMPETDYNIEALLSRIKALEEALNNGNFTVKNEVKTEIGFNNVDIVKESVPSVEETLSPFEEDIPPFVEEEIIQPPVSEDPVKEVKKEEVLTKSSEEVDATLGKRIWGTVVRKLRTMEGKTILWVACQEMSAVVKGDTLIINSCGENEKQLLLEDDNLKALAEIISTFGNYKISIDGSNYKNKNESIESVSNFFKDTVTIK